MKKANAEKTLRERCTSVTTSAGANCIISGEYNGGTISISCDGETVSYIAVKRPHWSSTEFTDSLKQAFALLDRTKETE